MVRSWLLPAVLLVTLAVPANAQNLEIHVVNVGWGQSTLIKGPGPTGKTVLLEAGNTGKGTSEVLPYLQSIGHLPAAGFDYTIVGHQHCDHAGGMDEVINGGYNVRLRNYYNGSSYSSTCITGWNSAAAGTTAGAPVELLPGAVIDLGGGATLTCIASRGKIIGGGTTTASNENDLSIALLLKYGGFDYYWASDLGGGSDDGACTGRSTSQINVETPVMVAISPGGANPLISSGGVDVLHVSHHGSESSTNNDLFDLASPAVAVISTGAGQDASWNLPRIDVVERVLLGQATACVTAPPTFVLQTEEGAPMGSLTSTAGYCVGDIKITTDGMNLFTVSANGTVSQGPNELAIAGLPRSFTLDETGGGGDTTAPTAAISSPAAGATVSGVVSVTASASDNVAVTKVEFFLDAVLKSTDTAAPWEWSWDTLTTTNGSHSLTARSYDAAGNATTSSAVSVTVNNVAPPDTTAPTAAISSPAAGATVSGVVSVTASASDNVAVTKVEFFLDAVLKSTDTAAPWEWSWDTLTTTNGSHSLTARSYDAAGNATTSSAVSVTVNNVVVPPAGIDVSGYRLNQTTSPLDYIVPAGTVIPSKGYVVISRNSTRAQFEAFWGRTLGTNVVFLNSADGMPQINGDEKFTLYNASGTRIDGATVAMDAAAGRALQRKTSGCTVASKLANWTNVASASGNPGSGAPAACAKGVYISEFSDALGTGNFIYEFVELYNDK